MAVNDRTLIEAAREVFRKRGYHGATLDQVAERAGLTKGAVYARHESKADLFLSLLAARVAQRTAEIRALPPPVGGDGVDAVFQQWLERTREDPAWALVVLEFRIAAARDRALNARYAEIHERTVEAIAERVALGVKAAGLTTTLSAHELARIGLGLSNGLLLERLAAGDRPSEAAAITANAALFEGLTRRRTR